MELTVVCRACGGSGENSRYAITSRTEGVLELRYAPRMPRPCGCVRTDEWAKIDLGGVDGRFQKEHETEGKSETEANVRL